MQNSLKWCFKLKDGLKFVEPDELLYKSYLNESKSSLNRANKDFLDGDLLWSSVIIYYADYYVLYSFLVRLGVKCEYDFCSILAVEKLLGEEKVRIINEHRIKRIDAQYYMKVGKDNELKEMLKESSLFVSNFEIFVSNLNNKDVEYYGKKLRSFLK